MAARTCALSEVLYLVVEYLGLVRIGSVAQRKTAAVRCVKCGDVGVRRLVTGKDKRLVWLVTPNIAVA